MATLTPSPGAAEARPGIAAADPDDHALTGAQLWALLHGTSSYVLESPSKESASLEQCDVADQFLDTAKDWGEISENVTDRGLTAMREAQRALDKDLAELREHGILVYGSRRRLVLTGGVFQGTTYWWEISLAALTINDPRLQDPH